MSDHPIIATPHSVEAVEAVLANPTMQTSVGPVTLKDAWLVIHLDGERTFHDTDPRIEPTYPSGSWGVMRPGFEGVWVLDEDDARHLAQSLTNTLVHKPHYPITLDGKPYTLVGEWVEVEGA